MNVKNLHLIYGHGYRFNLFFSQNDRTKLEIGKIYDQSSGKYVRSCPMTERYFDLCKKKYCTPTYLDNYQTS